LHCVPAVNLFAHDAEPISVDGRANEYHLLPSGGLPHAYEVFSVDKVSGWEVKTASARSGVVREYFSFDSFQHEIERSQGRNALYFRTRVEKSAIDDGLRYRIAFVRGDETQYIGKRETISADLTCTNRDLPVALGSGDICVPTQGIPAYTTFANLTHPTEPYRPVLDGSLHWTLISNLSLNYLSLLGTEPLKAVIRAYDFAALHDIQHERNSRKRIDGIKEAKTQPINMLIKGLPVRGLKTTLELDQSAFLCEGEVFLFGTVLSKFFALYASINSFHLLEVKNISNNETYSWPLQRGNQPVI
jgi:type VI secretion system protein ImpG